MKTTQLATTMLALAMTAVLFSACKDEESNASKYEDSFTLGSEKMELTSTLIMFVDQTPNVNSQTGATYYRNELAFANNAISIDQSGDFAKLFGTGNIIHFEVIAPSKQFDLGVYTFTGDDANLTPFNIYNAAVYVNYNVQNGTGDVYLFTSFTITTVKDEKFGFLATLDGKVHLALKDSKGNITGPDLSKPAISLTGKFSGDTLDFERED